MADTHLDLLKDRICGILTWTSSRILMAEHLGPEVGFLWLITYLDLLKDPICGVLTWTRSRILMAEHLLGPVVGS
jgi:hypothetical protein